MTFNDRHYTQDALIKQLGLVELHGKDGSAVESGCACIQTKHSYNIEGLSEEGMGFALNEKEKRFYSNVADWAREIRKRIEVEDFDFHGIKSKNPTSLTVCERKRERCIKKLKPKEARGEIESAYAVCRASIPCPPKGRKFLKPKDVKLTYKEDLEEPAQVFTRNDDITIQLDPRLKQCPTLHDSVAQHELVEGVCLSQSDDFCHTIALRAEPEVTRGMKTAKDLWNKCIPSLS